MKTGPFGTQLHASDYVEHGTPVINVRNIGFGSIVPEKLEFISDETVERLSSHLLQADDIVFGRKGAVERHAFIKSRHDKWFQGSDCLRLRAKGPNLVPRFLSYCFLTEDHKQWMMNQCSHGATMASLNQAIICRIRLRLPPPPKQRSIVEILSAYDDLIENNTRRIKILEDMAQMLYREWFVNFRFPGHEKVRMVESELGPIPEGWEVSRIVDFGNVVTGKTPSKTQPDFFGADVPFIKLPDMHGNVFVLDTNEHLSFLGQASQANKTIPANSLCVSCIGTAGIVVITTRPSQTNQQINSIVLDAPPCREFLYFRLLDLRETINQYGANGATMVNLNKTKFENLRLIRSPRETVTSFHDLTAPMFEQVRNLQQRNANLRTTRDLLLPKLISGEISVEASDEPAAELMEQTA